MKMRKRSRRAPVRTQSGTEIRPAYTVYPDDDVYGSPRSWTGATLMDTPEHSLDEELIGDRLDSSFSHLPRNTYSRSYTTKHRSGDRRLDRPPFSSGSESSKQPLWLTQSIGAVFLVSAAFLFFHSDRPLAVTIRHDTVQAFAQDLTSIELPPAVARAFGTLPSSGTAQVALALPPLSVVMPVQGTILQSFSKWSPDIVFQGRPGSPVVAAADGLVDSAGESQANGYYVTIDHGSFGQTLYAHLGSLRVHAQEYVTAGQIIGNLPEHSGKLTFGYIRGGTYQNPAVLLHTAKQ